MVLCCGCESREPLYLHLDMSNYEMSLEEYKYYIITKAIGDNRSKSWFDISPTKVIRGEKLYLKELIDNFLNDRYNWNRSISVENFGNSDDIYTQRFIEEMAIYDLNNYIPTIVKNYNLTSIIDYAAIMPHDYVQKKVEDDRIMYRIYTEINMNVRSSSDDFVLNNEIYTEGSNSIAFWIFIKEEDSSLKIDGWYEMIQGEHNNMIIPYWSKSDAKNDAV